MTILARGAFLFLFCALLAGGCREDGGRRTHLAPDACMKWGDVEADDVVLTVCGAKYLKSHIDRYVDVQRRLITLNRRITKGREQDATNDLLQNAALVLPLFAYYAAQFPTNVVLPSNEIARVRTEYVTRFGRKKQTWDDFRKDLDKAQIAPDVDGMVALEAKLNFVLAHSYSNDLAVTAAELAQMNAKIDAYLAKLTATNALLYAAASNAWRRLEAGEDFAKVADACSQDPERNPGGDLGELDADDFSDQTPHFQEAVARLKEGQHTDVLESTTGLEIVKFVAHVPAERSERGEDARRYARIFFRRVYFPERETPEELEEEMRADKRRDFLAKQMEKALAAGEIAYPFSRRIFRLSAPPPPTGAAATNRTEHVESKEKKK